MKQGVTLSASLHVFVLTLLILGLPHWAPNTLVTLQPIAIEVVPEISETTKAPRKSPVEEILEKPPELAKKPTPEHVPKPVEKKPKPLPQPSTPPVSESVPKLKPAPIKPKDKPKEKPKVTPKPTPKPKKVQPKVKPKKKVTPPAKKKTPQRDFNSVLKNLQKSAAAVPMTANAGKVNEDTPVHSGDISDRLSMSELDALRRQIAGCWNIPAGARDAENLVVKISVSVNPDGTVRHAKVVNSMSTQQGPYYQIAAESALRAVLHPNCSPLKLPANKYKQWKEFTFTFNPKEML
ncbi:MAG: energy transducer TonB [Pseudomonadota bacterium]